MADQSHSSKAQHVMLVFFAFLSAIVLADFLIGGSRVEEEIRSVVSSYESHNNAGGGYYYSYQIETEKHHFPVTQRFASTAIAGQTVQLKLSRFFREVNRVKIKETGNTEVYSLRVISGLIFPLLTLFVLALSYKYSSKVSILTFVFQALNLANLIFLLY